MNIIHEKKIYSQNGEDGVIQSIFDQIKITNKIFVEFGVESGIECNTRHLRENLGWTGLMLDNNNSNFAINLRREFINAENINSIFKKYNVPNDFDLLSIDIDGNDYWVWKALGSNYKPRVIAIEYNSQIAPDQNKIIEYNANRKWDGTDYFGAGILPLYNLGQQKGYNLIYIDSTGTNAFFVLKIIDTNFKNINNINALYKLPGWGGHPHNTTGKWITL